MTAGSSSRPMLMIAWSCRQKGHSATGAPGRLSCCCRRSSSWSWTGSKLWRGAGLTSMMVLGDFLRRRIAPLQQSRMACMYTGSNDCCRIMREPGTDLTRAELEASIRAMTGEAFTLESLVLPRGIKALCEDQAMRSAVLASMPTLDEGGLAVRQVGGDPNRGSISPAPRPTARNAPTRVPVGPATEVRSPLGKGKGRNRSWSATKQNVGATPTRRDDDARGAATARSSQEEGFRSRRLQRGDGSFMGEPAPKRQKTAEAEGQSSSQAPPPPPQCRQSQEKLEEARRSSPHQQTLPPPTT
jgi:hypothetical protein